jgi:hypothetical protein
MNALSARIARIIALAALAALGLSGDPFPEPFQARCLALGNLLLHETSLRAVSEHSSRSCRVVRQRLGLS